MNSPFLLVPVLGGRLPVLAVQGEGHHIDLPHPGLSSHGLAAIVLSSSAPWWSLLGGVAGWPGRASPHLGPPLRKAVATAGHPARGVGQGWGRRVGGDGGGGGECLELS